MEVKVNLEKLRETAAVYDQEIQNLEEAVNRLDRAMDSLRSSKWDTAGSKAFFAEYDEESEAKIREHIEYLKHLRNCLKKAYKDFSEVYGKEKIHIEQRSSGRF